MAQPEQDYGIINISYLFPYDVPDEVVVPPALDKIVDSITEPL